MTKNLKFKVIAVDYDGTLEPLDTYGKDSYPSVGKLNEYAISILKAYRKMGGKVILFTCRTDKSLELAVENCKKYGLEFDAVNKDVDSVATNWCRKHNTYSCSNKVTADLYIDDRSYDRYGRNVDWYQVKRLIFSEE